MPCVVSSPQTPKASSIDKGTLPRGHPHSIYLRKDILEGHSKCRPNLKYSESVRRRDDSGGGCFSLSATEGADEALNEL